jgi:hypothetical protein
MSRAVNIAFFNAIVFTSELFVGCLAAEASHSFSSSSADKASTSSKSQ